MYLPRASPRPIPHPISLTRTTTLTPLGPLWWAEQWEPLVRKCASPGALLPCDDAARRVSGGGGGGGGKGRPGGGGGGGAKAGDGRGATLEKTNILVARRRLRLWALARFLLCSPRRSTVVPAGAAV